MSFYVSTATFFLLHCDEWDRVVALPRHKFVTGATLLQLTYAYRLPVVYSVIYFAKLSCQNFLEACKFLRYIKSFVFKFYVFHNNAVKILFT